jgi:hypothetical protein
MAFILEELRITGFPQEDIPQDFCRREFLKVGTNSEQFRPLLLDPLEQLVVVRRYPILLPSQLRDPG